MKSNIPLVKELLGLCEEFVVQTQIQGNESAWTDRKLEKILEKSKELEKQYNNNFIN